MCFQEILSYIGCGFGTFSVWDPANFWTTFMGGEKDYELQAQNSPAKPCYPLFSQFLGM